MSRAAQPALLPWQCLFAAYCVGLLAGDAAQDASLGGSAAEPWTFAGAGVLVLLFAWPILASRTLWCGFFVCLAVGCGVGWRAAPGPAPHTPDWLPEHAAVAVRGRVAAVEPHPDNILRILLEEVRCTPGNGPERPLPGGLVWTWQNTAFSPQPGQCVAAQLKVKPIRGFVNAGSDPSARYWARRGMRFRAFARGAHGVDVVVSGAPTTRTGMAADASDAAAQTPAGTVTDTETTEQANLRVADAPWQLSGLRAARQALRDDVLAVLGLTQRNGQHPTRRPPDAWQDDQGGGMLMALLFGDRRFLHHDTMDRMARASLAHSLALSGLHLALVAAFGFGLAALAGRVRPTLFLRLPRPKLGVILAAPLVAAYVWLGGPSPSLTRAAVMFSMWGVLLLANRDRVLLDGLFLALVVLILPDPQAVHSMGLQLSALAVAGIIVLLPLLYDWADRVPLLRPAPTRPRWLTTALVPVRGALGLLAVSLVATIALLPLTTRVFGFLSLSQWLNMLWLPLLGLTVLPLGFLGLAAAASPLPPVVAHSLLHAAAWLLQRGTDGLAWLDAHHGLRILVTLRPHAFANLGYWTILAAATFLFLRPAASHSGQPATRLPMLLCCGMALLAGPAVIRAVDAAHDRVTLTLLDVGQGQAVLVDAPGNIRVLVDGGGGWPGFDMGKAVVAPALTDNRAPRLNAAVMTHPDRDHYPGLIHLLRYFTVDAFIGNGQWPEGDLTLRKALADAAIPILLPLAGETIPLGPDLSLEVLHPPAGGRLSSTNNRSLVLRLVWRGHGLALLTGDIEPPAIEALLGSDSPLAADVLVLPHHGSAASLHPTFYARVAPRLALASAGFRNAYGFPGPAVRAALHTQGVPLLATSDHGAITLTWTSPSAHPEPRTALP